MYKIGFAYFDAQEMKTNLSLLCHPVSLLRLEFLRTILLRPPLDLESVSSAIIYLL